MRDNPVHVAAYRGDRPHRQRQHAKLMGGLLAVSPLRLTAVTRGDTLLAVMGEAPPGACRLTLGQGLRVVPTLIGLGPAAAVRVLRWAASWSWRDPAAPHVHLGPMAVDAHLQGQGLGSLLLLDHCRRLDEGHLVGYLETDKPVNVTFYRRFGYRVVRQGRTLGVPTWFMRRDPTPDMADL